MSDNLAAAAKALDAPEAIVKRSAEARAKATGMSVEDVLAAWAGGAPTAAPSPAPAPAATAPAAPSETPAAPVEPARASPVAAPAALPPPGPSAVAPTTGPAAPPVLEGPPDRPLGLLAGAVALFLVGTLLGFVVPILPTADANAARSSAIAFTEAALDGRAIYGREGCGSCHTQQVRPVVSDVGLGPVTLADSNQVLGATRIGPDLAHAGSRADPVVFETLLLSLTTRHPYYGALPQAEIDALVAYLSESK